MGIKPNLFSASMMILLVEAMPLAVVEKSPGKYRLSLGASAGDYEYKSFDCDGSLINAGPVQFNNAGAKIEVWGKKARISVFGGRIFSDATETGPVAEDYEGTFGGVLVAGEWEKFGLGLGVVNISGGDGFIAPAFYLRGGKLDHLHLQLDLFPPSEIMGNMGWARFGLGTKRVLVGIAMLPFTYVDQFEPRVFAEVQVPFSPRLEFLIGGQLGAGENRAQWGLGSGIRIFLDPEGG